MKIVYLKQAENVAYGFVAVTVRAKRKREGIFSLFEKEVEQPFSIPFFFSKNKRLSKDDRAVFEETHAAGGITGNISEAESIIRCYIKGIEDMLI